MRSSPSCTALIIADHVHRDSASGRWHIIGTMDAILCQSLPSEAVIGIYFVLSGFECGDHNVLVRVVEIGRDQVCSASFDVTFNDITRGEFHFGENLITTFDHVGDYLVEVLVDGEIMNYRPLKVMEVEAE
ncbi:MAG: hypothetical protein KDA87_25895 [Planctomycetales bacterium]|nr:hypothetical protein [Planctomycetales bacterium]